MPDNEPIRENQLARRLQNGEFALTAELTPPVAGSARVLLDKAMPLKGKVDAVNVTDGASARVHMSSLASAAILAANGIEPVLQFTCRDRNRIALMGDLLGASALGVQNLLLLTGDDPTAGDQPDAKPVFDLSSGALIELAATMTSAGTIPSREKNSQSGSGSRAIEVPPKFFVGAADIPTAETSGRWRESLRGKIETGAQFLQTQICYDMEIIRRYADLLRSEGFAEHLHVLISNGPLASARSARWMRDNFYGVVIPDTVIERLENAEDPREEGVRICAEQIEELATIDGIAGAHLIAPINTSSIPDAAAAADISRRRP